MSILVLSIVHCVVLLIALYPGYTTSYPYPSGTGVGNSEDSLQKSDTIRIVFVYFMVPTFCEFGLPEYIYHSLNHTLKTQTPHAEVVLLSNFKDCYNDTIAKHQGTMQDLTHRGLLIEDSSSYMSARSQHFINISREVFAWDNRNELWMTSALRFFILEDLMRAKGWQEVLHLEADNLLYIEAYKLLPLLRKHYPLAATPLGAQESLVTASVFWVSELRHLRSLTSFILKIADGKVDLEAAERVLQQQQSLINTGIPTAAPTRLVVTTASDKVDKHRLAMHRKHQQLSTSAKTDLQQQYPFVQNLYREYTTWLRPYACCKVGGIAADERNIGLKPYALNEMTMLAFFRQYNVLHEPDHKPVLLYLPVVPAATEPTSSTSGHTLNQNNRNNSNQNNNHNRIYNSKHHNNNQKHRRGFIDTSLYAPYGPMVGPSISQGIWDPNSWGQYLGGTNRRKGKDKGFVDVAHIAGQMMMTAGCKVSMLCDDDLYLQNLDNNHEDNNTHQNNRNDNNNNKIDTKKRNQYLGLSSASECFTAPFVMCDHANYNHYHHNHSTNNHHPRTPLYNLHVHAKQVDLFLPQPCVCGSSSTASTTST